MSPNFNILDPLKTTILTPGVNPNGGLSESGIPASVVAKYLAQNNVIIEKCELYSFFVMFTLGVDHGKWTKLIAALKKFKTDYDSKFRFRHRFRFWPKPIAVIRKWESRTFAKKFIRNTKMLMF